MNNNKEDNDDYLYLNEFHKKSTLELLKEVAEMAKLPFTIKDFEEQVKRIQPNGKHKQRAF